MMDPTLIYFIELRVLSLGCETVHLNSMKEPGYCSAFPLKTTLDVAGALAATIFAY